MDARELLRQYLAQRRELGESEFVLDSLSVEAAMKALGAKNPSGASVSPKTPGASPLPSRRASPAPAIDNDDWREALRAAGAGPSHPSKAPPPVAPERDVPPPAEMAEAPEPEVPAPAMPADASGPIIIGSAARELFGGRYSDITTLDGIAQIVKECTLCPLHATATNAVPGEGSPTARLVCVGEAPGATEDETGRPFVGRAGDLLTKILEAIDLKREDVFIVNVLKHRPPGNRNPAPDEIVACRPYLMRQLELLRPSVILGLGTFAAQTLLETKLAIGKLRGNVHQFYGTPLVVTYHPAALLRNPHWKRPTWEDVKLVRRLLDDSAGGG